MNNLETVMETVQTVPSFGSGRNNEDGVIFSAGEPFKYKGDCGDGIFFRGSNNLNLGETLKNIIPINFYQFAGKMYKVKDACAWGELIFLDEKMVVSSMLIKTIALDKFVAFASEKEIYEEKQVFGNFLMDLTMIPKSSNGNDYFFIEFTAAELGKAKKDRVKKFTEGRGKAGLFNLYSCIEFAKKNMQMEAMDEIEENLLGILERMNIVETS